MTSGPREDWQPIEWLGMAFFVPRDWEIVRHSVRCEAGRLTFVDRRAQRLQLGWVRCRSTPAVDRMISDYQARDQEEDAGYRFRSVERGIFRGYRRVGGPMPLTRAGTFDEKGKRWIELTIPWHERYDAGLERALIDGFDLVAPGEEAVRWRAFGLTAEVPPGWRLHRARVWPGETELRFRMGKGEAQLRRIKSLEDWFDGNLLAFLRRQIKGRCVAERAGPAGSPAEARAFESWEDVPPIRRWLGFQRRRRDLAWVEQGGDAICQVSTMVPPKQGASEPEAFRLGPQSGVEA